MLLGVDLYYVIKLLLYVLVIVMLWDEGVYFDLVINGEVDMVVEVGVDLICIIYMYLIKCDSDICYVMEYGCDMFVFDNLDELKKFIFYVGKVNLLLRLSFCSLDVKIDLLKKFGCSLDVVMLLL